MTFNKQIKITNQLNISSDDPVFVIAEAGVNHGGDINVAKQLIDTAARAGADAVKFQAFRTENLILENVEKAPYQKNTTDSAETQFEMLKKLEITQEQNLLLKSYCEEKQIVFLTTPFDEQSLDELDAVDLPAYKIASTDITNLPFLKKVAKKEKPIFLSTGMAYLSEVQMALEEIFKHNKNVVLLQCSANYPILDSEANLAVIEVFKKNFDILVGYSDHSVGIGASPYAIPMGAKVVEKHFTLDKGEKGPDHLASLNPNELIEYVKTIRRVEEYMGNGIKAPTLSETKTRSSLQKCLVASREIKEGEPFTEENIVAKRTGGKGISPIYYQKLLGTLAGKDYTKDEIIAL